MSSWAAEIQYSNPPSVQDLLDQSYWLNDEQPVNQFTETGTFTGMQPESDNHMHPQHMHTFPQIGTFPVMQPTSNCQGYPQQSHLNNQQGTPNSMQQGNCQGIPLSVPQAKNHSTEINSQSMASTPYSQPVPQIQNNQCNSEQQYTFNDTYVTSVSLNLILKFILRRDQLKNLRSGNCYSLNVPAANPFKIEIDPDGHLNFQPTDFWESFDLDYAFVESKDRAFSLEESSKVAFLTPFQPTSVDDEDVMLHCKVTAYPRYFTTNNNQHRGTVVLPTVSPSPSVWPINYKNENVINFIRKGIIPKFDVDTAIEILRDAKTHKCKVLTILCMEYLMKNSDSGELAKISKAARESHLQLLEEKCLIDFEKCVITEKEKESEENKMMGKEKKKDKTKKK